MTALLRKGLDWKHQTRAGIAFEPFIYYSNAEIQSMRIISINNFVALVLGIFRA